MEFPDRCVKQGIGTLEAAAVERCSWVSRAKEVTVCKAPVIGEFQFLGRKRKRTGGNRADSQLQRIIRLKQEQKARNTI